MGLRTAAGAFRQEVVTTARRTRQAWGFVPLAQKVALLGAFAVMCGASAANTAIPVCLGRLVESANMEANRGLDREALTRIAAFYLAAIGAAYLVREALNVLRRYLAESACTRIDRDLYIRVVGHVMSVELSCLAHEQVGALHSRIARSVDGVVRYVRLSFLDFIPALITGGFALMAALSKEPRIALVMIGVAPISVALTLWQLVTQRDVRLDLMRSREAMDGTVVEQLGGLDYVRAANTAEREVQRVSQFAEVRRGKELRHHFEMSLFGCGKALNEGVFHLLVLAYAIALYLNGSILLGDILTFSVLYMSVMAPLNEIHRFIVEAHESGLRIGDLAELTKLPVDRSFRPVRPGTPALALGSPLFVTEDLRVEYPTPSGRPRVALDGVSLTVRHGETIGVAGRSGCGKTTWLRVLMRLTHPTSGHAALADVPLDGVTRDAIGDLVGYVGQNPFIFSGTVADNIAYVQPAASREDIVRAAMMACIHDEIVEMPGGYDAPVAERGQNLSGGQRQRLALARVFLKNPPVLVLDEGTSALDNISERKIQHAIERARADRTVILVAHRLSTLLDADRIFVFHEGRVVETGTYDELVLMGGHFSELVRSAEADALGPDEAGAAEAPARRRGRRRREPAHSVVEMPASA